MAFFGRRAVLKQLKGENMKLKRLVAGLGLRKTTLQDLPRKRG